ncbi:MAG: thiol protease/hemagglutinin PrtT [Lentimicrobiaceae bacterium]|jgi:hypothetical protein
MKRFLLPLIFLAFTNLQLYSKSIDEPTAKTIAATFLSSVSGTSQLKNGENIVLIYKATALVDQSLKSSSGSEAAQTTYFYIFSSSKTDNFVIVSGDDRAKPILGYSNTSSFDPGNIPPNMKAWLDGYICEIQYAIDKELKAGEEITEQWFNLSQGISTKATAIVEPLIKTHWAQSPYYNDLCPYDNTLGKRVSTGCTATAMAQIMKYWNYPVNGTGTHSYIPKRHPEYGVISADFGNTQYDWASMPDQISAPNEEIARLMFHCGVSIDMDYGTDKSSGHTLDYNHPSALLAFRDHFGYKSSNKHVKKSDYSTKSAWINLIVTELNAKRPVLYAGVDEKVGGHAFVCDGYDNSYYFHFNWGWGEYSDGYFTTDAINLGTVAFTKDQDAIIGIEPVTSNPVVDIRHNSKVSISPSIYLTPGQPFTLTAGFKNFGAATFNGSIEALAWNDKFIPVGLIDSTRFITLASGENTEVFSFSTNGISAMTSGEYYIIFYSIFSANPAKPIDKSVTNNGVYELIKVTVSNNNTIAEDEYENNNSEIEAHELIPIFNDSIASEKIQANIHNTADIDYYKIKLPVGYNYIIASFLDDYNQKTHTLDGKYSYKFADDSWSTPEDIVIPDLIHQGNDDYLYFKVEPFLLGYMGTYDLSYTLTREEKEITSTQDLAESIISVYPMPNNGHFTLKLGCDNLGDNEISILNINGAIISKTFLKNPSEISKQFDLEVANGVYFIRIKNNGTIVTKKIIIM